MVISDTYTMADLDKIISFKFSRNKKKQEFARLKQVSTCLNRCPLVVNHRPPVLNLQMPILKK